MPKAKGQEPRAASNLPFIRQGINRERGQCTPSKLAEHCRPSAAGVALRDGDGSPSICIFSTPESWSTATLEPVGMAVRGTLKRNELLQDIIGIKSNTEFGMASKKRQLKKIDGPPTELEFEKALMFFHAYMYGPLQGKLRLYSARSVRSPGAASSSDWEVFASILVKDAGKKLAAGVDLTGHEVKSAEKGGSYEYQYHKRTGKDKLLRDMEVGHLFFDHRNNLRNVDLRFVHGSAMKHFFTEWLENFPDPYPQRYRKNIPFKWVKENGILLMTLTDGEVTFPTIAQSE